MQGVSGLGWVTNFYKKLNLGGDGSQFLLFGHGRADFAVGEACGNVVADFDVADIFQELTLGVEDQGVSTLENRQGRQRLKGSLQALAAHSVLQQDVTHDGGQGSGSAVEFLAHAGKNQAQIVVTDGRGNFLPATQHLLEQLALGEFEAVGEVVEPLLALMNEFHHADECAVLREFGEGLAAHQQAVTHGAAEAVIQSGGVIFDFLAGADDEFGRSRGRGSAEVGNEVDDREIGFVADGGDYGDLGGGDGAGQRFVVERGEVFGGAATARDDDYVDIVVLIEVADAGGDLKRRGVALHLGRINHYIHGMVAALEHIENVAESGGLRRCDHADARRKGWDRLLAFGGEQTFSFEFGLELLEG